MAEISDADDRSTTNNSTDESVFKSIFRRHASGVAIVACTIDGTPYGFTATSFTSVSAHPPRVMFSVAANASVAPALARCATVSITLLAHDQAEVSRRFASRGVDRFATGGWTTFGGDPVMSDGVSWLHGPVEQRFDIGGSLLVLVRVQTHRVVRDVAGLIHVDRSYHPSPWQTTTE